MVAAALLAAAAPARATPVFDAVRAFPLRWGGAWWTSEEMSAEGPFSVYAWVDDQADPRRSNERLLSPAPYAESYAMGNKYLTLEPGLYLLEYRVEGLTASATATGDARANVTLSIGVDCLDLRCAQLAPGTAIAADDGPYTESLRLPVVVVATVLRVRTRGDYTAAFTAKATAAGGYQVGDPRVGPAFSLQHGGRAQARAGGTVTSFSITTLPSP